ncbi:predicted protein [Nematostella vectensis]|uniref:Uncharacterized protein n=1 Tax=Nematostella vectensis TaxID=45351 RepID=A7SA13_NEMVE|nr:predicted protein [Nematostella vectensis]|eukprot:XP_001631579.1 predicted protein [Nematostella vectensis]
MDSSPVQRLMSKKTKTTLPLAQHLLEPELQQDVTEKLTLKRKKAKKHFDRGSKELPELNIGEPVRMTSLPKETKKLKKGVCIGKVAPRSYLVDIDGSIYRRNRKFIRNTKDHAEELVRESLPMQHPQPVSVELDTGSTDENHLPTPPEVNPEVTQPPLRTTRSGRITKPPVRLDL